MSSSIFPTTTSSIYTTGSTTTTSSILPNTTEFIIIVDPKCKSYYSNSSGVVIKSYEGIPENLVVNLVVWICLLVLYTFLRKIGDYGRFGLVKTSGEESWTTNLFKKHHQKSDDSQMIITDSDGDQQQQQRQNVVAGTSGLEENQQQQQQPPPQQQDPEPISSSNVELGLAENSVASTSSNSSTEESSNGGNGGGATSNTRVVRTGSSISNSHEAYHSSYYKDKYFFSWIINLVKLKDKHINEKCGKDAIYYLVFQRYLIVYIIFVTVVSLAVILPINLYGKALNDNSLFGSTTIVNILPTSSVLWVHCIISWLFLVVGIIMMRQFSKRMDYSEADYVSRTVLITNYPILWCKKDLIYKHFREAYPDLVITDLQFVYDTKKLFKLDRRRHAMHVGRVTSEKMLEKTGLRPLMHPYHCGSMFELCCCCMAKYYQEGSLADSIDYYTKNENEVVERMRELRERTLKKPLNIIFLTFQNQNMAAAFLKDYRLGIVLGTVVHNSCSRRGRCQACYLCKDYPKKSELSETLTTDRWHVKYAPSPSNIKWENMSKIGLLWWLQVILINIVLFIMMMFFTTPSILLDKLNELGNATTISTQSLENYFPSYIAEFLPSIILRLVAALLPVIVAQTALLERHWTRSAENKSMMGKTYILLLFMILILPTLGLTSINALLEFKANDNNVKWTCVSDNGAFFVKYIITFSFIGTALDLLRLPDLFMYIIRMIWSRSSAERLAVRMQAAFEFDYGVQYAWILSLFTVMISYSVVCPLITPFGLIYLVLKHTVDRYNIYFGFTATKVDKQIHKTAVSFMIAALLLLQLSILFFIALRNQGNINTNAMTTIQIIILSFSLFIYLGRIFFGIFKRFSPFKYKQTKQEESPYAALSNSSSRAGGMSSTANSSSSVVTSSPPRTSQPDYDSDPINLDEGSSESRKKRELKAKKLSKRNNVQSPFLPHVLQAEYEVPMSPLHKSMSMTNYGSKKTGGMKRSATEPLHLNVPTDKSNPELSIRNPAFVPDEDTDDQLLDAPNVILNENQIKLDISSELDFRPMSTTSIFDQINEERAAGQQLPTAGPSTIAEESHDFLINIDHKPADQNA